MRLLLATNHLGLGGSESYLLTVAEQLDRLGHEVSIYSPEPGPGVEAARERLLTMVAREDLNGDYDAALVQDAAVSLELAEHCPETPQVFVAHSESFDVQAPPQLEGIVGTVIALNDRIARRLEAYSAATEVVRLKQPIDTERFTPRRPLPEKARHALLLSNAPNADRLAMLELACAEAGLELARLGGHEGQTADIRPALAAAEIVIGYGRSILEAMACGCAAYVYDWNGGEGWMTAESYAEIEADGIAGRSGRVIVDAARLAEDLSRYSASMGPVNHDLVIAHHRANVHAQQLVEAFRRLAKPQAHPIAPLQEMARLVRLEWRARLDVQSLARESGILRQSLIESQEKLAAAQEAAAREAQRSVDTARAYEQTLSWRLTRPIRALGRLRGALRRRARRDRTASDLDGGGASEAAGSPAANGREGGPKAPSVPAG